MPGDAHSGASRRLTSGGRSPGRSMAACPSNPEEWKLRGSGSPRHPYRMATTLTHSAAPPVPHESRSASREDLSHREGNGAPGAPSHAWVWRWLLPALGVVSLLLSCVLWSLKKPLLGDEAFTHIELSDPSLRHLLSAATRLGGAGMPLFYLTAWPWAHFFGLGDLSLRLYSSAGVCGAFFILCSALQRRFGFRAGFLGAAFGLFASLIVMDQNVEARGYGLYLLLAALAVVAWLRIAEEPRPGFRDLALLALTQAGLVLGHVIGLLYGGLMLLALVVLDRLHARFRLRVYAGFVAGWLALILWIPAIRASAAVGRPHSWIPVPSFGDLAIGFSFWLYGGIYYPILHASSIGLFAGWLCAVVCVAVLTVSAVRRLRSNPPEQQALILLGLVLMLAPFAFFAVSVVLSPIYVARYMIPSAIGVAILAASWVDRRSSTARTVLKVTLLLALPVATALLAKPAVPDIARVDRLAAGRPVVCDWLDDFLVLSQDNRSRLAAQYPLDWQAALHGPPSATGAYKLMENYRQAGYLTSGLLDLPNVLSQSSFVVLDNAQTNWFHLEIESNPRLTWRVLAQLGKDRRIIAVEQMNSAPATR